MELLLNLFWLTCRPAHRGVVVARLAPCRKPAPRPATESVGGSFLRTGPLISRRFGDRRPASSPSGDGRIQSIQKDQGHSRQLLSACRRFRSRAGPGGCLLLVCSPQQNMRPGLSPTYSGSQITRSLRRRLPRPSRPRLTASVFTDARHGQFLRQPEHIVCHWL